jgi:sugar lactone lactonase YvrE
MKQKALLMALLAALFVLPLQAQVPLNTPEGLAFDTHGNLYVANYGTNQVLIYDASLTQTGSISEGLSGPNRLAFDSQGNLYVSNGLSNSITVYDPSGNQITSKTITKAVRRPLAVAVDASGDVFVGNNAVSNISVYNSAGVLLGTFSHDNRHNHFLVGAMAILGPNIYIGTGPTVGQSYINSYNIALLLTGHAREVFTYFDTSDEGPTGIAFDASGNVYVDYYYTGTAAKYSPSNQLLLTINTGHYGQGEGIAVDQNGNIYLAFGTDTINVYDPSGNLINTLH